MRRYRIEELHFRAFGFYFFFFIKKILISDPGGFHIHMRHKTLYSLQHISSFISPIRVRVFDF